MGLRGAQQPQANPKLDDHGATSIKDPATHLRVRTQQLIYAPLRGPN